MTLPTPDEMGDIDELEARRQSPSRATREEIEAERYGGQSKSFRDGWVGQKNIELPKLALVSFIVAVVAFTLMGMIGGGLFLTKTDFEKNLAGMTKSVEEAISNATKAKTDVDNAIKAIPNQVTAQVNTSFGTLTQSLTNQMLALVAKVDSKVDSFETTVSNFNARMAALESKSTDYEKRIKALETKKVEEAAGVDKETRWTWDIDTNLAEATVAVWCYFSPSRIEEEDYYDATLVLTNKTNVLKEVIVTLTLTPKSGDEVYIDERDTFLDTVSIPHYLWEQEVVTRGSTDYTRRVIFTSEKIKVPAGEAQETNPVTYEYVMRVELELSLAYE